MFHTTGLFQPPFRPQPAGRVLRFGRVLEASVLQQYQDVFERMSGIRHYGAVDLQRSYGLLSTRARNYLGRLELKVTPEEIDRYKRSGKLGTVEESADMLFELYTLKAVAGKLIDSNQVAHWVSSVKEAQASKLPFFQFVTRLAEELPEAKVRAFQNSVGLPADRSRLLLALIGTKFTLFQAKTPGFDMLTYTRPRMFLEAKELVEAMPVSWLKKAELLLSSWMFSRMPSAKSSWFRNLTVRHVTDTLKLPVQYGDLMHYAFVKQLGRQELDYDRPDMEYTERKRTVKPFEVIYESAMLKDAEERLEANNTDHASNFRNTRNFGNNY